MRRLACTVAAICMLVAGASCGPSDSLEIVAEFRDVGDLVTRANVQQSDAVVGTVSAIELRQQPAWVARVTLSVGSDTIVPPGTRAIVRSTSLLGEKFVDLVPPEEANQETPNLPDGAVIPVDSTGKAPELEEVFSQLGAILASGGLQDLAALTHATAIIVEGREQEIGRVLDGTAKVVDVLARQRDAIAEALDTLESSARTLSGGRDTTTRFLQTSDDALGLLAEQRQQLEDAVVQLDRLGSTSGALISRHKEDMDRSIKSLLKILPALVEGRAKLDAALGKLPDFARLFAAAIPGDYVQLDVGLGVAGIPIGTSASASASADGAGPRVPAPQPQRTGLAGLLWSVTA